MPLEKYFDKFPKITYSNTEIIDITRRVAFLENVSKNPYIYYPYEIIDNERPDQLSTRYYKDPFKSWILYLSNKIVDPYFEWYMTEAQFNEFLEKKYGSLIHAYEKINFYRNDWLNTENITISRYDSLSYNQKKYWDPVYLQNGDITSYARKKTDWTVNTNRIVSYAVNNPKFTNNEICDIHFDNYHIGKGQILSISNNTIYVHHTSGVTESNSTVIITGSSYIYGKESFVNTTFTNSTLIVENLASDEEVYWKPITYYDYEQEKNEYNKTIRILDVNYSNIIVSNLKELLK